MSDVKRLMNLTEAMKAMEKEIKGLKEKLKPIVESHNGEYLSDGIKLLLVRYGREFFDLKQAKLDLDNRVLKPYITSKEIESLRISREGGLQ